MKNRREKFVDGLQAALFVCCLTPAAVVGCKLIDFTSTIDNDQHQEDITVTPTPSPTPSPTATPSPTPSPSGSPSPSPT